MKHGVVFGEFSFECFVLSTKATFSVLHFLCYRATLCVSAVFAVARCPSVTRSCILSRWLKIS